MGGGGQGSGGRGLEYSEGRITAAIRTVNSAISHFLRRRSAVRATEETARAARPAARGDGGGQPLGHAANG